ncbi:MAG: hypothetical protein HYZ17_03000 [Betaproteobacteria bacterium]|nr:hypothetical protein [Betaproteobacteria bacterium]
MLLSINTKTRYAEKRRTERLQSFGLDERALQNILFFTGTMFGVDADSGRAIRKFIQDNRQARG